MALTPLADALNHLLDGVPEPPASERISVSSALWRVLACDVIAPVAVPPFDNSAMDGYAVLAGDVPGELAISQRIPAGSRAVPLESGTAARIFTGAPIPEGADTVVIQEDVLEQHGIVSVLGSVTPGAHIRRRGADIAQGSTILPQGRVLTPQDMGLLASVGHADVSVYKRLRIAILTTGDELVEPGGKPEPWQIFNSNASQLSAQLSALGCDVVASEVLPDCPTRIGDALERMASVADCIVTCGGVSVGEEDHVKAQIEARGRLNLWKLAIKPGKPLAFGEVQACPIFGLPGNPVSAWVTFALVVKPWILKAQGARRLRSGKIVAEAQFEVARPGSRQEYLRVTLQQDPNPETGLWTLRAVPIRDQSSGVLSSVSQADALAVVPLGATVAVGDPIEVLPINDLLSPLSA